MNQHKVWNSSKGPNRRVSPIAIFSVVDIFPALVFSLHQLSWCSGYHIRLARGRSPIHSWTIIFFVFVQKVNVFKLKSFGRIFRQTASTQLKVCGIDRAWRAALISLLICGSSSLHIGAHLTPAASAVLFEII